MSSLKMIDRVDTGLGIKTEYLNVDFSNVEKAFTQVVEEFSKRANQPGQFLNWVGLPAEQLKKVDEIYELVDVVKNQTGAKFLTILGIGGSKHPVEHMLAINGLNVNKDQVLLFSDVDSVSLKRFLHRMNNDVTSSNYLVVSKSGSTFETKDGMLRFKKMLADAYRAKGYAESEIEAKVAKHFVAVTDKNAEKSELRRLANAENWAGKLFIHDDVGGRFSALDDHVLYALAHAGMPKEDMKKMLEGASKMSELALSKDVSVNDSLLQAAFWVSGKLDGITTTVHQYLGLLFEDSVNWHAQMQNESVKDTSKQIAKVPDAMHHSSEAHFNPANRFAFALTTPVDNGSSRENLEGYVGALNKSYSDAGLFFYETAETQGLGLKPETAGALTQSRAFSTVYQELIEKNIKNIALPEVLDSVLQPHVEVYKKNLKPQPGEPDVVVAGRIS